MSSAPLSLRYLPSEPVRAARQGQLQPLVEPQPSQM